MNSPLVVVMGVSGAGKSTVGRRLAAALSVPFCDGDDLHPPANIAKQSAGIPLVDADRFPWLDRIGGRLAEAAAGQGIVVACSALRRSYRDRLRGWAPELLIVHLTARPTLLRERTEQRAGHFMPPALLPAQLATLEPPGADEAAVSIDVGAPVAQVVETAHAWVQQRIAEARPQ